MSNTQAADTCVSVSPYFKINSGQLSEFKRICQHFVERSATEPDCLYYGFSFNDNIAHCREGFKNAEALLAHIENLKPIMAEMGTVSALLKIEVHGIASELAKLKAPLAEMKPEYFVLEYGFRR